MIRVHDLTLDNLDDLPDACRRCVFWEVADATRGPQRDRHSGRAAKEAWWQATQLEWGSPGKAVYVDSRFVGYLTFGPPEHFPRARRLGRPISDDALLLATMWVDPAFRSRGLARMLLQSALRETYRRGARALEAITDRTGVAGAPCVLPEDFLLGNGFTVRYEDRSYPVLRLDLRQTVRWQESVGHALEGVLGILTRRERGKARARPALEAVAAPSARR